MKILAVRTGKLPEVIDIEHSLDAESEFVVGFDGRDDFCDISDSDAEFYMDFFSSPNSYC